MENTRVRDAKLGDGQVTEGQSGPREAALGHLLGGTMTCVCLHHILAWYGVWTQRAKQQELHRAP